MIINIETITHVYRRRQSDASFYLSKNKLHELGLFPVSEKLTPEEVNFW